MATPEDAFRPTGPDVEAAHVEAKSIDLARDLQKLGEQQIAQGNTVAGEQNLYTAGDVQSASDAGKPFSEANVDMGRAAFAKDRAEAQQAEVDVAHTEAKSEDLARGLTELGHRQNADGLQPAGEINLSTAAFVAERQEAGTPVSEDQVDRARAALARINAEKAESVPPAQ